MHINVDANSLQNIFERENMKKNKSYPAVSYLMSKLCHLGEGGLKLAQANL